MHNEELNTYSCEKRFTDTHFKNFSQTILLTQDLILDYEEFKDQLELFFNDQLEDGEIKSFKGKIFELSDAASAISFPFSIVENKLKFMETDAWRSTILTALAINKCQQIFKTNARPIREEEENEQYNLSQP